MHIPSEVARKIRSQELDRERQDRIREQAVDRYMIESAVTTTSLKAQLAASSEHIKILKIYLAASIIGNLLIAAFAAYQFFNC